MPEDPEMTKRLEENKTARDRNRAVEARKSGVNHWLLRKGSKGERYARCDYSAMSGGVRKKCTAPASHTGSHSFG